MKKSIFFSIFLVGFTAMSAQIVLLRQLIVVFYGNEISVGFVLAAWLFWGAVGSWLLGRLADKIKYRLSYFAFLQIALAFVLVGAVFVIRAARTILGTSPGEIIGFLPMAAFSLLVLCLICVILGFLFALACRLYPPQNQAAAQIGRVYILEALGAVCGGCLVSFFFIRYFDALYLMWGLALLNLISAYFLQFRLKQPGLLRLSRSLTFGLIIVLFALLLSQKVKQFKQASIREQWKQFTVLTAEDSIYSNLVVTKRAEQYSFFSNGLYLFTVPDQAASEEAVHFALLETPNPKQVLLIGAGIAGLAAEILKHPIDSLDYVELDPRIIKLGKEHLPPGNLKFLNDQRLHIFHQDGRLFIKQLRHLSAAGSYDSIIVCLGTPFTAQINRFYTLEFFRELKRHLSADGVFSFSVSSSENFLNIEQQRFLASLYKTLNRAFREVKIIPGEVAYFLATDKQGILTYDYRELTRRLNRRRIRTEFVRDYYLFAKLSPDRIRYLEEKVGEEKSAKLNTDFRPISYYYDMLLWSTYFTEGWRKIFALVSEKRLWLIFSFSYLAILAFGFLSRKKIEAQSKTVLLAVATTGLTELGFQVIILLAFQVIYGYLYYKLGILLSSFMVGLVAGSWLITNRLTRLKDDYGLFIKTQVVISLYPLLLPVIFSALTKATASSASSWLGSNVIFPALPIISGFVGGFQFPLANKIILKDSSIIGQSAGLSYGMDLLGSCAGALLVSAFLVPVLGISRTCIAIALLNCAVLLSLMLNKKGK